MKIAITGGSGFIATRLIQILEAQGYRLGQEIVIIDIKHTTPIDILDQDKLNAACAGCDVIYHLAAAHRDDVFPVSEYYEVNAKGTQNVIRAAQENNISKIIFTSTVAVYGLNVGTPTEESPVNPFNDYGHSKLQAEGHLREWENAAPENTAIILRPVVVFGEENRGNVYTLMRQISSGRFMMIGRGENKKSMAYVGNVAGFLAHCLKIKDTGLYNYADKPDLSTKALIQTIQGAFGRTQAKFYLPYPLAYAIGLGFDVLAKISGRRFPISRIRVQKFCAETTVEAGKYQKTGFQPPYSLSEGIKRMINHDFNPKNEA